MQLKSLTRSILRYPGSKARLAKFIAKTISLNNINKPVFVEPFCGGASVSIALLEANIVSEVVINDIDPLVASLWKCVFSKKNVEWLVNAINQAPLNLNYWQYQKNLRPKGLREAALKCLYLNRTSFSGVLHSNAGPIGGRRQIKWTLGCRFNREKLISRILELSQLSDRVKISRDSWVNVCKLWRTHSNSLFYLDPPFYHKADRLYNYSFSKTEHNHLSNYLMNLNQPWILSYDNATEIRDIYDDKTLSSRIIDNTYAAHPMGGNSFVGREVVYSNLKELPPASEKNHIGLTIRNSRADRTFDNKLMRIFIAAAGC